MLLIIHAYPLVAVVIRAGFGANDNDQTKSA